MLSHRPVWPGLLCRCMLQRCGPREWTVGAAVVADRTGAVTERRIRVTRGHVALTCDRSL